MSALTVITLNLTEAKKAREKMKLRRGSAKAKAKAKGKAKAKTKSKVKRRLSFGEKFGAEEGGLQAAENIGSGVAEPGQPDLHIAEPSRPAGDKRQPFVRGPTVHKNPPVMQTLAPPGCTIFLNCGLV